MSATTDTTIACRLRRNGNMPRAPEQLSPMQDGWMKSPGMPVTPKMKPIPSEKRNRLRGACTTCRGMYASWSRTGTRETITAAAWLRILPARRRANSVVFQAGVVADFAGNAANAASPTASKAQEDDAEAAVDSAEDAVNFLSCAAGLGIIQRHSFAFLLDTATTDPHYESATWGSVSSANPRHVNDEKLFLEVSDEQGLDRILRHSCARGFDSSCGPPLVSGGVRSEQTAHARWKADESLAGESARLDLHRCKEHTGQNCELGIGDSGSNRGESKWLRS